MQTAKILTGTSNGTAQVKVSGYRINQFFIHREYTTGKESGKWIITHEVTGLKLPGRYATVWAAKEVAKMLTSLCWGKITLENSKNMKNDAMQEAVKEYMETTKGMCGA